MEEGPGEPLFQAITQHIDHPLTLMFTSADYGLLPRLLDALLGQTVSIVTLEGSVVFGILQSYLGSTKSASTLSLLASINEDMLKLSKSIGKLRGANKLKKIKESGVILTQSIIRFKGKEIHSTRLFLRCNYIATIAPSSKERRNVEQLILNRQRDGVKNKVYDYCARLADN